MLATAKRPSPHLHARNSLRVFSISSAGLSLATCTKMAAAAAGAGAAVKVLRARVKGAREVRVEGVEGARGLTRKKNAKGALGRMRLGRGMGREAGKSRGGAKIAWECRAWGKR